MKVVILEQPDDVAQYGADIYTQQLHNKPESVLGLATGSTPLSLYRELIARNQRGDISFRQTRTFNLDEYMGLTAEHPQSYRQFMNREFFDHIDIDLVNTRVPPVDAQNPFVACAEYEQAIESSGGIDIQLLGIGRNGHIGFNEPTSSLNSRTRVKTLTRHTVADNARFFADDEFQPQLSLTMGIGTIMEAKQIVLLATGEKKADAVRAMIEGPVSAWCPASALQFHRATVVLVDNAAASKLSDPEFFKHIEQLNQALLQRGDDS